MPHRSDRRTQEPSGRSAGNFLSCAQRVLTWLEMTLGMQMLRLSGVITGHAYMIAHDVMWLKMSAFDLLITSPNCLWSQSLTRPLGCASIPVWTWWLWFQREVGCGRQYGSSTVLQRFVQSGLKMSISLSFFFTIPFMFLHPSTSPPHLFFAFFSAAILCMTYIYVSQ